MKKMRRMIPALCMLLVSAIMLSTASYAWFTMNEQVEATGINIQAKAAGSLIIGGAPLKWNSANTSVDLSEVEGNSALKAVQKLSPITWSPNTNNADKWVKPDAEADIHPSTGKFNEGATERWTEVKTSAGHYVETAIWVASAGDALTRQHITLRLDDFVTPVTEAVNAYAMAIYIVSQNSNGTWSEVSHTATPAGIIYLDEKADRNTITLTQFETTTTSGDTTTTTTTIGEVSDEELADGTTEVGFTIPSIVGVGAQDEKTTGLKIVVRFFVDGNLPALEAGSESGTFVPAEKEVVTGVTYEPVETFVPGGAYFINQGTSEAPSYVSAVTEGWTTVPTGVTLYTQVLEYGDREYNYVNSDEVPTSGTALEITVRSEEIVTVVVPDVQG